jgi:hypothetical protein
LRRYSSWLDGDLANGALAYIPGIYPSSTIRQGLFLDLVSVAHRVLDNEGSYTQRKSRYARVGHKGQLTMLCLRGRLEPDILIERTALFAAFSLQQATRKPQLPTA